MFPLHKFLGYLQASTAGLADLMSWRLRADELKWSGQDDVVQGLTSEGGGLTESL